MSQITIEYLLSRDNGFKVHAFEDPQVALSEFEPNYYDLVILDIRMPVLNGFELCKKIIELDKTVHIKLTLS